jgi:hypothetical protein
MAQVILAIVGTIIGGIILLNIEYTTFVPRTIDNASNAEHKALQLKRQLEAEEEAAALQARLNAQRLERENKAREAALEIERAKAQQEEAARERRRQAELERRERQNYIDNYRKTHGGCDPGYNKYCTYVGGMVAGCSCM